MGFLLSKFLSEAIVLEGMSVNVRDIQVVNSYWLDSLLLLLYGRIRRSSGKSSSSTLPGEHATNPAIVIVVVVVLVFEREFIGLLHCNTSTHFSYFIDLATD